MRLKFRPTCLAMGLCLMLCEVVEAATPCPPPQLGVVGGTSATTTCPSGSSTSGYSTNFPLTENPLSEGGKWVDGKVVGLDWNNPESTGGRVVASTAVGGYDDDIAELSPSFMTFSPKQFAEATVYKAAGYSPASAHEIELYLHMSISAHNTVGYECGWGTNAGNASGYFYIVVWLGPVGYYDTLYASSTGAIPIPQDGDVFRAEIVPTADNSTAAITLYRNGVAFFTWSDVTKVNGHTTTHAYIASGQPGLGFWPSGNADPTRLGWKQWKAGNL